MPSASSQRNRSASVRGLMPAHECSICVKRLGPSESSWTMRTVHLAPMISAVAATEHVSGLVNLEHRSCSHDTKHTG